MLNVLSGGCDPGAALNIVSVSQLDNMDYCVCDGCAALAGQYGGPSGTTSCDESKPMPETINPLLPANVAALLGLLLLLPSAFIKKALKEK